MTTRMTTEDLARGPDGKILIQPDTTRDTTHDTDDDTVSRHATNDDTARHTTRDMRQSMAQLWGLSGDTRHDTPELPMNWRVGVAWATVVLLVLGVVWYAVSRQPDTPAIPAQPTADLAPTPVHRLARAIVAYYDPSDMASVVALDDGTAYTFVARRGDDWAQIETDGGAVVWVQSGDLTLDPVDLEALAAVPDLTPPTVTPIPTALPTTIPAVAPVVAPPVQPASVCVTLNAGSHSVTECAATEVAAQQAANSALAQAIRGGGE